MNKLTVDNLFDYTHYRLYFPELEADANTSLRCTPIRTISHIPSSLLHGIEFCNSEIYFDFF